MALRDLLQGAENAIGNAAQGVGNFVNQDIVHPIENAFQPPIQQPIPQSQSLVPQAPPIQNFMDWLGQQGKNFVSGQNPLFGLNNPIPQQAQAIQQIPQNVAHTIQTTPLLPPQLVNTARSFVQGMVTPTDQLDQSKIAPVPGQYQNFDPAMSFGNFIGNDIVGGAAQELPQVGKLGFNLAKGAANAAITAAAMYGANKFAGNQPTLANVGIPALAAGIIGTVSPQEGDKAATYLAKVMKRPADADRIMQFVSDVQTGKYGDQMHPDFPTMQAVAVDAYGDKARTLNQNQLANLLDVTMQRVGQRPNNVGLGLQTEDVRNGQTQPPPPEGQVPPKPSVVNEEKPTIKQELTQEPLPPKMSSQAIQEGIEQPRTGRDISVSPQAAIRYRIAKNAGEPITVGNPEPLPWETPEYQAQNPFEGAKGSLPPKEELPNIKVSNKEQPVKIANPNATVQDARRAMDTAQTQIIQRGRVVQQLVKDAVDKAGVGDVGGNETNNGANRLFRQVIEHPEQEGEILRQVKNPTQFKQALDQFREFTGYNLKAAQDAGAKIKGLPGYYSHIWDLSDPEKAAEFQQLSKASAQNYKGWYNKPRVFNDIAEGESYGFRLKNKNVADDVAEYTNAFAKEQGARVLSNRLVADFPDKAVILSNGDPAPIDMKQSEIPGAKGLFTSPEIKDQLRDLEPGKTNTAVKIVSGANNAGKISRLAGGLFHVKNTGFDYLSSNLTYGRFPRLFNALKVFSNDGSYINYLRNAVNDGTLDKMAKANITLDSSQNFAGQEEGLKKVATGINKYNPLSYLSRATFQRLENFFKIEAFKALDNRGFIDTSTPEGIKDAQGYGREINNMFGGQNRNVGDDIFNKDKTVRVLSHLAFLAPDYQQGRFKRTFSALGIGDGSGLNPLHRNAANNYAAATLAVRIALTAMYVELARKVFSGSFSPNLASALKNDVLDPNYPTPWNNTSANGTKEKQVAHAPASNPSDIYRLISNPPQFLISHLGTGLSDMSSFISNTDYFGNKLSQTDNPIEKLWKIGGNDLPIPAVQAMKVISGRVPIGNAIINELGDRVSLDPNDPTALYFNAQKQAMNNLLAQTSDPKMQNALTSGLTQLQSVGALNPNDPRRKQVEYTTYAAFPQLFQVQQQAALAQAGGDPSKADPLFTSPYANEYIEYEQVSSSAPGSSEEKDYLNQHPELIPLIQARAAFYQAHPIAQNPNAPAYIPAPQPNQYVQQQLNAKNYTDPQVQAYLNAHNQFINGQRQAIGLPMLNSFGQNPMEAAKSNASFQRNQMYSLQRKLKYINKETKYQSKKQKEKYANLNRNYARIKSRTQHGAAAPRIAQEPIQSHKFRIVAPPTVKTAGYKAAFKVPANVKYPKLTIG